MKILFLSTTDSYCGIASYTKNLIGSLPGGIQHDLYSIPEKVDFQYYTKKEVKNFFKTFVQKSESYDAIHIQHEYGIFEGSHGVFFGIKMLHLVLRGLARKNKPTFVTFHSEPLVYKNTFRLAQNKFLQWLHVPIKIYHSLFLRHYLSSHFSRRGSSTKAIIHTKHSGWLFRKAGFAKSNIHIIRHGVVPVQKSTPGSTKLSIKLEKGEDIILSTFGFISEYKGYLTSLKILKLLPKNFKLQIIGGKPRSDTGDFFERLMKKIRKSKLEKRVIVSGYVETSEIQEFFRKTDICLAPYDDWNLSSSGAITWALASGKPVIASNIHAFREVNFDTECLMLGHPQSPNEFAWCIKRLIKDSDLEARLINNAQLYAEKYAWPKIGNEHAQLYKGS